MEKAPVFKKTIHRDKESLIHKHFVLHCMTYMRSEHINGLHVSRCIGLNAWKRCNEEQGGYNQTQQTRNKDPKHIRMGAGEI
mmetsp:Transcript_8143/g.12031  ORF Transcript_8143/g.12031 Transcript_8143/m.12031 type:complete len:82 (+) Transcript_8143:449-694(+)